jgi:DNA-binding NtrC family response regulator
VQGTGRATLASMGLMTSDEIKAKIFGALRECGGNRTHAAERLGITRQHLYRLLDQHAKPREIKQLDAELEAAQTSQ